MTTVLSDT